MKHFVFALALLFLPAVTLFGATVDVQVGPGLSFNPSSVTITQGDTIRWVWQGVTHTSTSNTDVGPEVWNSGVLSTGIQT